MQHYYYEGAIGCYSYDKQDGLGTHKVTMYACNSQRIGVTSKPYGWQIIETS